MRSICIKVMIQVVTLDNKALWCCIQSEKQGLKNRNLGDTTRGGQRLCEAVTYFNSLPSISKV